MATFPQTKDICSGILISGLIHKILNLVKRSWCLKHDLFLLGETSKFNFCDPRFPHSLTESNYIVCDFCRSLTELSGLSI